MISARKAFVENHRAMPTELHHRCNKKWTTECKFKFWWKKLRAGCQCYGRAAIQYETISEMNPPCQCTGLTVLIDQNCLDVCVCVLHTACEGRQLAIVPKQALITNHVYLVVCGVSNSWSIRSVIHQVRGDYCSTYLNLVELLQCVDHTVRW
jgi:hypothetical protein